MANRWANNGNSDRLYFLGLPNHCRLWLQPGNKNILAPWKKSYEKSRQCIKNQKHHFATKGPSSQGYGFSSSWTIKKAEHRRIDVFQLWCWRRLLRVSWTAWRSNQSTLKEIDPEYSLEGLIWNSNTLATWCEELKLVGKDPDAGKDWGQEEKGAAEDEMSGWHHHLNGYEFEQAPGDGEGQRLNTDHQQWKSIAICQN